MSTPDDPTRRVPRDSSVIASEREALDVESVAALLLADGVGPVLRARLARAFGSVRAILEADRSALESVPGIGPLGASRIRDGLARALDEVPATIALLESLGIAWHVPSADRWPLLASIPDPPHPLLVRGTSPPNDLPLVAIVGSRRASAYGVSQADRFASSLAQWGVGIISGGARGIDAVAHRSALRCGAPTWVVLGSGHACPYPPEHASLFDDVIAAGGGILTEHAPSTRPLPAYFPRRNRIVSGFAVATLVVEASARSGALVTARLAVEEHGREVLALPGRVDSPTSSGCHRMIREGWARLVTDPEEVSQIVEESRALLALHQPSGEDRANEDARECVAASLDAVPRTIGELAEAAALGTGPVLAALARLEMRGIAARLADGRWIRTARASDDRNGG